MSKEDLTGHKQKKEHFVTYAKKSAFLSETSFSWKGAFKRVIGGLRPGFQPKGGQMSDGPRVPCRAAVSVGE